MAVRAFITGLAGTSLSDAERAFLGQAQPWGLILFARNCDNPGQVAALVSAFRQAVGRADAPVLIDQEGGRVQRLGPPHWPQYPTGRSFGALYEMEPEAGLRAAWLGARLIADDLARLGIDVDCLPLLDLRLARTHAVIGDRAYSHDPTVVAALGQAAAEGLMAGGVLPVVKHMPGHGRATSDSHVRLPVVDEPLATLEATDFVPFRLLRDQPMGMTAHIVYGDIDANAPATVSPRVVSQIIRGSIGFVGLLMSDDLSMQALSGSLGQRAAASLAAGCDIALHCNGNMNEMRAVAEASPPLQGAAAQRAAVALGRRRAPQPLDRDAAWREMQTLLARLA